MEDKGEESVGEKLPVSKCHIQQCGLYPADKKSLEIFKLQIYIRVAF